MHHTVQYITTSTVWVAEVAKETPPNKYNTVVWQQRTPDPSRQGASLYSMDCRRPLSAAQRVTEASEDKVDAQDPPTCDCFQPCPGRGVTGWPVAAGAQQGGDGCGARSC